MMMMTVTKGGFVSEACCLALYVSVCNFMNSCITRKGCCCIRTPKYLFEA